MMLRMVSCSPKTVTPKNTAVTGSKAPRMAVLLYQNEDGATLSFVGTMIVFLSSLSYAIYIVAINQTRLHDMVTLKVTFYVVLFGWFLFAGRTLISGELQVPQSTDWWLWGNLIALAVMPTRYRQ